MDLNNFNLAYRAAPYVIAKQDGLYGNTSLANNIGNPLLNLDKVNNGGLGNRVEGTIVAEFKPVSWITLRSSYGVDLNFFKGTNYSYAYDNSGTANVSPPSVVTSRAPISSLIASRDNYSKWVWDNTATFAKTFDKHHLSLLVGTTAEQYSFNGLQGTALNVPPQQNEWFLSAGDLSTGQSAEHRR